tara:strand:+ start:117 stop:563 length:447 start_codon:yes stop_codon:yes gene_type:complete
MILTIVTPDKAIGIGSTFISGIGTDMSWIPTDVHAVHWDGSTGEIEYNDGKPNTTISEIGIYSQAETTLNNELKRLDDLSPVNTTSYQWEILRNQRDDKLLFCDWTQGNDTPLGSSKKTEWATYRQALRDLPANTSDPKNPTWPSEPS